MKEELDDLLAVKNITEILKPFEQNDRDRIVRWVFEKLGQIYFGEDVRKKQQDVIPANSQIIQSTATDIKSFVASKNPQSDNHLVAVIAYYNRFIAPETTRKEAIDKEDIANACRMAGVEIPTHMPQVLVNSFRAGLLDKIDTGVYKINTVGENLVAMTLPGKIENRRKTSKKEKKNK